jgi:predicted naringenin-chalcone synthase
MKEAEEHLLPHILGIGTAVPGEDDVPGIGGLHELALPEMLERLSMSDARANLMKKIFKGSGIRTRHMVCTSADELFHGRQGLGNDAGVEIRMALYRKHAPVLALKAAEKAIADWKGQKSDITHVIGITCTGVLVPGIEMALMHGLKLRSTTQRLAITFMGCFGTLSGLKTAKALAAENPTNRVLMVCCELCSLHMQLSDVPDQLVAAAIFADGAGAMIIGVPDASPMSVETPLYACHRSSSTVIPNTLDMMAWDLTSSGMVIGLGKEIPLQIYQHIRPFAADLLSYHSMDIPFDEATWALHPGGPLIMKAIIDALDIERTQTQASWDVLRDNGNMSSATLIFVLDAIRTHSHNQDRWVPSLAFGPGLNVEGALLRRV